MARRTALAQATPGFITQRQSRLGRGQMFLFTPGQHLTGRAALPAQDRAWEDGGEGEKRGREMEKKLEDVQFAPKAHEQVSSFLSSLLHPPLKHLKLI